MFTPLAFSSSEFMLHFFLALPSSCHPMLPESKLYCLPTDGTGTAQLEAHWWPCSYSTPSSLPEPCRQEPQPLPWTSTGREAPRSLSVTVGVICLENSTSSEAPRFIFLWYQSLPFWNRKDLVSNLRTPKAQAVLCQELRNIFQGRKLKRRRAPRPTTDAAAAFSHLLWDLLPSWSFYSVSKHSFQVQL